MSAKLVVVAGPNKGKEYELGEQAKVTLGRGDTAQVKLADPTVSRAHCVLDWISGKALLKDNGSKTGTRVNGKAISAEHLLQPGEIISIGTSQLKFMVERPAPVDDDEEEEDEEATSPEELCVLKGTKLGHFQIGDVVAVGGSGVVFRAQDLKDNREVALKVYLPEFAQEEDDLQRFIRAVKTMLPMRHPNLITLFGGGKTGPYCWMSMEFVEGESLTETIGRIGKGGKLDWRPALRVAMDISRGLNYIHGENIIHRNLSPGNILFSRTGTAKLGSLILAKALSGALAKEITVGGELLGDVRFLAPEQAGAGGPVDGRADIYSLGTLVYALLTGKAPFEGKSPLQVATMILTKDAVPPRTVDPTIPEPLEKIVLRMLKKKADERFQSASELLDELERLPRF
jgi:serine/threonine protein kinase